LTIVKLSAAGAERAPAELVAVMIAAYRPGWSLFDREMRPWNKTLLVALWPVKLSVPAVTVYPHTLRAALLWVLARHLLSTLRPLRRWVKLNVTTAGSLSEKEKVVPTGGFLGRRMIRASLLPPRQTRFDCVTSASAGGACGGVPPGVVPPGVVPVEVAAAWTVALSSKR
jgi:hypothetical protein